MHNPHASLAFTAAWYQPGTLCARIRKGKNFFSFSRLATQKNIDRGREITILFLLIIRASAIQPASTYKECSA
jgi:hypothetical protein